MRFFVINRWARHGGVVASPGVILIRKVEGVTFSMATISNDKAVKVGFSGWNYGIPVHAARWSLVQLTCCLGE